MGIKNIFDPAIDVAARSMDFRLLKQNIISSNVANANTPDYKALKIDFEQALQNAININGELALTITNSDHIPMSDGGLENVDAEVYENPDLTPNNDGNSVNVDQEMTEMAQNTILYNASSKLVNKKLALLKYVIMEGGK